MNELETIGKWRYPKKKFIYEKIVLIKQTNLFGNTYFSNYIEWQGETRESFFLCHPAAKAYLANNPHLMLVTHSLHHEYFSNTYLGDRIRIELSVRNIMSYSVVVDFFYFESKGGTPVGKGWQKICFFDRSLNTPCKVPQFFMDLALSVKQD